MGSGSSMDHDRVPRYLGFRERVNDARKNDFPFVSVVVVEKTDSLPN